MTIRAMREFPKIESRRIELEQEQRNIINGSGPFTIIIIHFVFILIQNSPTYATCIFCLMTSIRALRFDSS